MHESMTDAKGDTKQKKSNFKVSVKFLHYNQVVQVNTNINKTSIIYPCYDTLRGHNITSLVFLSNCIASV